MNKFKFTVDDLDNMMIQRFNKPQQTNTQPIIDKLLQAARGNIVPQDEIQTPTLNKNPFLKLKGINNV